MATMLLRALLTVASLTVALTGLAIIDCVTAAIGLMAGDPVGICAAVTPLGGDGGIWLGVALGVFAAAGLLRTWVVRPLPRKSRRPTMALKQNLARIPETGPEPSEATPASILHATRLTRRIEAIETALESDDPPTREVTREWMSLLRDANDLHNQEELATEEFREINTRLLALFADPGDGAREEAREVAASP